MKKIFFTILILLSIGQIAYAQSQYTLLEPLPCIPGTENECEQGVVKEVNLDTYIVYVFRFSIALAVFLAVIMIIWGGFEYILSEVPFVKTNAKSRITNAILGLLGALVSYLILLTIDPRLVQINSRLDPINIDTSEVENYYARLAFDIRLLSTETQQATNAAVEELKRLKGDLERVEYALQNDQELDSDQITALSVEKAKLKEQITGLSTEISKNVASVIGQNSFINSYREIQNPENDSEENLEQYLAPQVPNTLVNGKYPTDTENIVQKNYNEKINEILSGDEEEAKKLSETTMLAKQRDFYINQIKEEYDLNKDLELRKNIGTPAGQGYVQLKAMLDTNTATLNNKLNEYKNNLQNPQKADELGVPKTEYKVMMQVRIEQINKALGNSSQQSP